MDRLQEFQNQINALNKKVIDLEKKKSIEDIILKSRFVILGFNGPANGTTNLAKSFDDSIFKNKNVLIKAIRIIPYTESNTVDISLTDGVTTTTETISSGTRINRLFDPFVGGTSQFLKLMINGNPEIFLNANDGTPDFLNPDYESDGIYALYRISTLNILCYFSNKDIDATEQVIQVKVFLECYIF